MLRFLRDATPDRSKVQRPELTMRDLVSALMRPSPHELSPAVRARLARHDDEEFYRHVISTELGPLVYERVQAHRANLAPAAWARLEGESRLTMDRNASLVSELERISARFAEGAIPLMVIKGPTLAQLTAGLNVRPFHDLDLLVHRHNIHAAEHALRSIGYTEIRTAPRHEYHRIFARQGAQTAAVVELHFDLGDRERAIVPDVAGIWHRSTMGSLSRCAVRAPGITDHLLLAMMQLPHHGWSLRLLTDVGLIVSRWPDQVEWHELADRARAWGMWALAASTLYVVDAMFGVAAPEPVRSQVRPQTYFRRAQWRLVMETVAARLAPGAGRRDTQLAPLLLLDRIADIASLVARRAVFAPGQGTPSRTATRTARRMMDSAWSLPVLARVLVSSIHPEPGPRAGRTSGRVLNGQR